MGWLLNKQTTTKFYLQSHIELRPTKEL